MVGPDEVQEVLHVFDRWVRIFLELFYTFLAVDRRKTSQLRVWHLLIVYSLHFSSLSTNPIYLKAFNHPIKFEKVNATKDPTVQKSTAA